MTRNSLLIGAALGLSTLLGGCDDNTTRVVEVCDHGSLQLKAVYHEVSMGLDYLTVDFYLNGQQIASVATGDGEHDAKGKATWINCGESTIYVGEKAFAPGEFYKSSSRPSP